MGIKNKDDRITKYFDKDNLGVFEIYIGVLCCAECSYETKKRNTFFVSSGAFISAGRHLPKIWI